MLLIIVIVHIAHHEEMRKRAKQRQSNINNSVDRDFQEKYCRQAKDGKQTAKQHDPDVTFIHLKLLSNLSFERRKDNKQISIFDFCDKFIQRPRRRAADHIAQHIKMAIVTWTDVVLDVGMPVHAASQVSANV